MLRPAFHWLDTHRLTGSILFMAIFAMAVRPPVDTDTWWHLQAGRVTLEQGRILQTDLFSHTRHGTQWVNHSWLGQVILYGLFDRLSYTGLALWMSAMVTAAFAFVYLQMEGSVYLRAFILVLAAATSALIWTARPQLFSFLLTAIVAYLLYLFKWRAVNRLWLLPPLFALWVNLHAGYVLGFMVLAAFLAGEIFNRLLEPLMSADDPILEWRGIVWVIGITALSALSLAINPNTTRMWTYYLETVRIGALQDFIQEWRSPDFHPLRAQPFIWLLLTTMAAMGLSDRRADGTDLALVGGFAYAGLLAGRNVGPFALVTAPVLSRHVAAIGSTLCRTWKNPRRQTTTAQAAINWSLLALVVALVAARIWQPLQPAFNEALQRERLPVDAVAWVERQQPEGQMFNHYNWGGYLIWQLWPDYQVFVDGRTDLYGNDFLQQYLRVQNAQPGFNDVLEAYGVSWVLMPSGGTLSTSLACQGEWTETYHDEVATIWIRSSSTQ